MKLLRFMQEQVAAGRYACVGDVVRALLEQAREDEAKRAWLDAALLEARSETLDPRSHEEIWAEIFREAGIEECALLERAREDDAKEKFLAVALHEAMESRPGVPAEEVYADLERAFPWLRKTEP